MIFKPMTTPYSDQKIWGAIGKKGKQFVILEFENEFTATYKLTKKNKTIYLIEYGKGVKTFQEVKDVCEAVNNPQ